jgi:hypothetical protein
LSFVLVTQNLLRNGEARPDIEGFDAPDFAFFADNIATIMDV